MGHSSVYAYEVLGVKTQGRARRCIIVVSGPSRVRAPCAVGRVYYQRAPWGSTRRACSLCEGQDVGSSVSSVVFVFQSAADLARRDGGLGPTTQTEVAHDPCLTRAAAIDRALVIISPVVRR